MLRDGELIYGLVVAVDIANFSRRNTSDQAVTQALLNEVLDHAAARACLTRDNWYRQLRGDGELAVLPADTDVAWVLAHFTEQLVDALRQLRSARGGKPELRLRLAMHHGTLTAGHFGPIGEAPILACRLLDARSTKAALAADPDSDLVLVVSQQLYGDVVSTRFHGLVPERFRPMQVCTKGTTYSGYLCAGTPRVLAEPAEACVDR